MASSLATSSLFNIEIIEIIEISFSRSLSGDHFKPAVARTYARTFDIHQHTAGLSNLHGHTTTSSQQNLLNCSQGICPRYKFLQTKMGKIPGTIALLTCVAGIAQSIPIPHDANNDHDCGTHLEQLQGMPETPSDG